jgi:hypothetical protein
VKFVFSWVSSLLPSFKKLVFEWVSLARRVVLSFIEPRAQFIMHGHEWSTQCTKG